MGNRIALVTYELDPITRGGAGVAIAALAKALAAAGHEVHVVADMPAAEVAAWSEHLRREGVTGATAYPLAELANPLPPADSLFQAKSAAFLAGLRALTARVPLDAVEVFEYAGVGFDLLTRRGDGEPLARAAVIARIHGSLSMIDDAIGYDAPPPERLAMHAMERWALRLADLVLAPVSGIADQYRATYGLEASRIRICPPPMERLLAGIGAPPVRTGATDVLLYGKLDPIKGSDVFVDAALRVAPALPWARFLLVGADTPGAPGGGSMREHLERRIPEPLRPRFRFEPHVARAELGRLVEHAFCAVVPSRTESFCLVAHELLRLGCPLIVSDIPAFAHLASGRDCLRFDGTIDGLAAALRALAADPRLAAELAGAGGRMKYPPLAEAYTSLPSPKPASAALRRFARREVEALGRLARPPEPSRVDPLRTLWRRLRDRP